MEEAKLNSIEQKIFNEYTDQDNCMGDFLAMREVPSGLSFEEAMEIYVNLMNESENDQFYRFNADENWKEDMVFGERSEFNGGLI